VIGLPRAACPCPTGSEICPRVKTKFARPFNPITLSSPVSENILLSFFQKMWLSWLIPSRQEGRFAIVTDVEAGSGGRVGVAARIREQTNNIDADG
jgi:hypothetical protein